MKNQHAFNYTAYRNYRYSTKPGIAKLLFHRAGHFMMVGQPLTLACQGLRYDEVSIVLK